MKELNLAKKEYYMDDFIEFHDKMLAAYIPDHLNDSVTEK